MSAQEQPRQANTTPDLEARFLEPEGWRWHQFKNKGRTIRYGSAFPKDSIPDAVVVCLPGLGEFAEKYFELAHNMLERNLAFWVIDWPMQGKSSRPLANPNKLHSDDFANFVDDLDCLCLDYIKPSSVHPDRGRIPMVMLGHSMGANIGMRYLLTKPECFICASLTAPLLDIKALDLLPFWAQRLIARILMPIKNSYVLGGSDWNDQMRSEVGNDIFSSDPMRGGIHRAWQIADTELRSSSPTFGWVGAAIRSCAKLYKAAYLKEIELPTQLFATSKEQLVNNRAIKRAAKIMPDAEFHDIQGAQHELFMEADQYRDQFFAAFDKFIDEKVRQNDNRLTLF